MDIQYKQLIPAIYLQGKRAVKSLEDGEVISDDPLSLAVLYNNGFADGLMVFDLSSEDEEQEAHNDIIRSICAAVRETVIV